ncbi:sensor histidine kinase [Aridibaculum aurantiacum]|uniref:sensor histidine kinase n=1 Tax=Aridibaculum aurantiacum TaxID=2810307 RepID=UPI001A96F6EA|nr:sensor histidine kinase [Aridibaculum aurantiacum]
MSNPLYKNQHFIILIASAGILLVLGQVLSYINTGDFVSFGNWNKFFQDAWSVFLQVISFIYLVNFSVQYFNKKYALQPNSLQRFLHELLFISLVGFLIQEVFRNLFIRFSVVPEDPKTLTPKLRQLQMISMVFLLVIYAFFTSLRIFRYLQLKQLELIRWQREFTQNQLEALKNQLNPHFLFNSLSVLTSLVYVDADLAERFIEKLSKTYRYLLEQKDKEKVSLQKELEFLNAYCFLVEQRFGKKLQVQMNINGVNQERSLPPHSLMIAMEYILANNAMSTANPLKIEYKCEKDSVFIQYNHQPKQQVESNSRQQINGLRERYAYLSPSRGMKVHEESAIHVIEYPLLAADEH